MIAKKVLVATTVLFLMLTAPIPADSLNDIMFPKAVSTAQETMTFDEIGTHETRKSLVGNQPITLFQTGGEYTGDYAACNGLRLLYPDWDCSDMRSGLATHTLEYDKYTFDAEVVYSYNIRHSGSVTFDITTTRQGNSAPSVEVEVLSSSDAYEVDVKASVEFTLKRTYIGSQGLDSSLRNTFTYSVPFPSLTDVDGDGSYKMLGNLKVFTWDNFADLSSLSTVQTSQLGSKEDLSNSINLASIDILELAGKFTSNNVLKAMNYFVYVDFDVDLDIDFFLQAAALPFIGTGGATSLSSTFSTDSSRLAYPCKLALTDALSSLPVLPTSCTRTLPQDATDGHLQLGLWHDYSSEESYSVNIRVGAQSNYVAQKIWNYFTNQNYFEYTLTSGLFMTASRSQDTNLASSVVSFDVPAAQTIIQNNPPTPVLVVSPTSTTTGSSVYASTSSSYDQDGNAFTVQVFWGDGSQSTLSSTAGIYEHSYNSSGTYVVTLEIIDSNGATSTTSQTVVVTQAPSTLTSYLSASITTITEGSTVNFSWGASGGSNTYNHQLNYGDGTNYTGSSSSTSKTYNTAGQYGVQLQTSDGTNTMTKLVQITVEPDYSSDGLNETNFEITGDQILVVVDDNDAELYPVLGSHTSTDSTHTPSSSRDALFESLAVMAEIRGVDWDLYFVENTTSSSVSFNNESGPGLNFLEDYSTVIWTTGNHWYPFTDTDKENLEIYADAGGTLIVFSQDMLFGDCPSCSTYNSTHILNQTFALSEADQDVGLGDLLYNSDGGGTTNVAYLPLAGLQQVETRNVSGWVNFSFGLDYADSVYTWDTNDRALGSSSDPVMNSSEGNHGILNMDGVKTAFFPFDPVQFQHRADIENMMLSLSEWGDHSFEQPYLFDNATYLPAGIDGISPLGPSLNIGETSTNRTNELTQVFGMYPIQGHSYEFKIGGSPYHSATYIKVWNSTSSGYENYNFSDSFSYCSDGPIASVSLHRENGSIIPITSNCDSNTGEWTVEWTSAASEKVFMVAEAEDMFSGDSWYFWTKVSFEEMADNTASISLTLNTETYDVLHAYDNTSNSQYYAGSHFDLDVQAGKTYAVTLKRPENSPTRLYFTYDIWSTSFNDIDQYGWSSDYLSGGATRGSLIFEALNTTTVGFRVSAYNYTNPHITDGRITMVAWELDANQPTDDYLNATDIDTNGSLGYVDYIYDTGDWWTQPVIGGESYSISVDFDSEDLFSVEAYFHPYDDPYNWSLISTKTAYGDIDFEIENLGFGELKILIEAECESSHWSGSRANYSIEINQASVQAVMDEIGFGIVGYDTSFDEIGIDMVEDSDYVIRLGPTPSWLAGTFEGEQLDAEIITPSGQVISSTSSGVSDNRTIVYTASETGQHTIKIEGENGSYWVWPIEDLGPMFVSSPQRYATAELPFGDTVEGVQYIISESFGYGLETWQTYYLEAGPSGFTIDSITGQISYLPGRADVGQHSISIRVDNEWGKSEWQNYTLVVAALPNTAPVITSTGVGGATVGSSFTTYVQATDVDNHSLTYSLSSGPTGAAIDGQTGQLTWIPTSVGNSQFSITVSDALGLSSSLSFNITSFNTAPLFGTKSNQTGSIGTLHSDTVLASDSDGHSILFGLRYGPAGLSLSPTGVVTWTPSASQVGDHLVVAEVNDAYGGSDILMYTITVPNSPATMTLGNIPATLYPGDTFALNSVLVDADGHEVWAVLQNGPVGTTMTSNGTLLWAPRGDQVGSHTFELLVIDAWGEGEQKTFTIEVLNRNPSGEFSDAISDQRLRTMYVIYSASDDDRQPIDTVCSGQDLVLTELVMGEQLLIEWSVAEESSSNLVSCTTIDDYGGSHTEEIQLIFDELNRSSYFEGDKVLDLGKSGTATWTLPFVVQDIETEVLVGNGLVESIQSSNAWSLNYTPDLDLGQVVIQLSATNEHGDAISQIWQIVYQENPLELEIIDEGPLTFGTSLTSTVSSTSILNALTPNILVGDGDVSVASNGSSWDVTYVPSMDTGAVLIDFVGMDEFGRISSTIWSITYLEEDLSWDCTIGEFEERGDARELEYSCSRQDVILSTFTKHDVVLEMDSEGQLITLSDLPYGEVVVYLQITGPDDRVELIELSTVVEKPVAEGSLILDNNLFPTGIGENYILTIDEYSSFTYGIVVESENTEFVFCQVQQVVDSDSAKVQVLVSSDCTLLVDSKEVGTETSTYRISLVNESDFILDSVVIEVIVEATEKGDGGFLAEINTQSVSIGAALGALIAVLAIALFLRNRGLETSNLAQAESLSKDYDHNMHVNPVDNTDAEKQLSEDPATIEKEVTSELNHPSATTPAQKTDAEGYEWYTTDNGVDFYRTVGSGAEWVKFEH